MKMEQTECFETSAHKIQTPGNYPEESIQHSEQSESLKARSILFVIVIGKIAKSDCLLCHALLHGTAQFPLDGFSCYFVLD
jgi:hypothetical protein